MRILMISTDRKIFDKGSAIRQRMVEYGSLVEKLHVIVFSTGLEFHRQNFENVFVYPTQSSSRWRYIRDAIRIGRKIISESYKPKVNDWVVTTQGPFETGWAGYRVAKHFSRDVKLPLQLQIHTDLMSPFFRKESLLNNIRFFMSKFLIPRADCVRVVSERIKDSLLKCKNVTNLPVFVDVKKIENAPVLNNLHIKYPQFDFIILMASRLTREKNIGLAVRVMRDVLKENPKVGLVVVGEGPEVVTLSALIRLYGLHKNILFEPWMDNLVSYYKTADLFLLTSNYEGYGRTIIEAMAADCPVVMTDVGLAGDIVKNEYNGFVAPVGGRKELAEAILKLVNDKALRQNIILSAKQTVDSLPTKEGYLREYKKSWENCFDDLTK